jgi:hypothetical protein
MVMFGIRSRVRTAVVDLSAFQPAMGEAVDRFARKASRVDLRRQSVLERRALFFERKAVDIRRRIPSLSGRHPVPHRLALPPRLSRRRPLTVLERRRRLEGGGGRPPFAESVERGAQRVAAAIRERLLALRRSLEGLRERLSGIAGSRRRGWY